MFVIKSGEEVGSFDVSAKFMGVAMEKVELVFQVTCEHACTPRASHVGLLMSRLARLMMCGMYLFIFFAWLVGLLVGK